MFCSQFDTNFGPDPMDYFLLSCELSVFWKENYNGNNKNKKKCLYSMFEFIFQQIYFLDSE